MHNEAHSPFQQASPEGSDPFDLVYSTESASQDDLSKLIELLLPVFNVRYWCLSFADRWRSDSAYW